MRLNFLKILALCAILLALTSFRAFSKGKETDWSISIVSGYTYLSPKKNFTKDSIHVWWGGDGQLSLFFSALELARYLGRYEVGARIQNIGPTFITPFFKFNFRKGRHPRFSIKPSVSLGLVPYHIMGVWFRFEMEMSLQRELGIAPFAGFYTHFKLKEDSQYEKGTPFFANTGIRLSFYY